VAVAVLFCGPGGRPGPRRIGLVQGHGCGAVLAGVADPVAVESIARLKASPFIPHKDAIRRFVFEVATGKLNEVF
jgi:hypothetical protein